ncbi:MAG TPA: hypothetical protein GXZ86_07555 [Clostridiales bacterium]|nr:hypothetical protein [Clostridiales bacterium]
MKRLIPVVYGLALILSAVLVFLGVQNMKDSKKLDETYAYEASITPTASIAPPTLFSRPTQALLRVGSANTEVKRLQEKLKELGYYSGEIDGQFGGGTKAAVETFQRQHGLVADGLAGESTLGMLYSQKAHPHTPEPETPTPTLVNKSHPLPDGYAPKNLIQLSSVIGEDLAVLSDPDEQANSQAALALQSLLTAAQKQGYTSWKINEGFRSFSEQEVLFLKRKTAFMDGSETGFEMSEQGAQRETERTVARPGMSEHHTGLAFDVGVIGMPFGDSQESVWLEKNAHLYGFILRYPLGKEDISGFEYEPWHIRYVGIEHAKAMHEKGLTLEEYLGK